MKWIWYEYEVDGRSQSYPTACPQWEPHSESYYPAHPFRVMVWYGVAPLRPPTTYKAWQTLSIGMKWIWYEYAGDGRSQSYPTAYPQWEPHSESYDPAHPFWSDGMVWWCGNITASHGWSLLNTFYRYEVDLVWVWSGCEVLIISYSMSPVRTPLRILRLAHSLLEWWYSMVLQQYGCQPWLKAFKHFL
jgi:hypothetical protein